MEARLVVYAGGRAIVDGTIVAADVVVAGDRIAAVTAAGDGRPDEATIVDVSGLIVAAGFIDLQCNGAGGHDLTGDPASIGEVAAILPRFGVTSFLPTVVTSPPATRHRAIEAMSSWRDAPGSASALGLHFEGPMISTARVGAHPANLVGPVDLAEIDRWIASGTVRLVTLAPELDGAIEAIEQLAAGGMVVSAGHTGVDATGFAAARLAGLRYVTHLFNAMAPFDHRAPGPIGAVLADDALVAGLICDGIHVDPVAVAMAWNALGPLRVSLVSDASPALGMPHGRMTLAGFEIVHGPDGVRTIDGVLAGSALALDQAVRNVMAFTGCSLADAVGTVTNVPADLLGLTDRGRLAPGLRADLVLLDGAGNLHATIVAGNGIATPSRDPEPASR